MEVQIISSKKSGKQKKKIGQGKNNLLKKAGLYFLWANTVTTGPDSAAAILIPLTAVSFPYNTSGY
ncbi:hypothetical protein EG339_08050 [Chryseobacterium bernardetii]|uniref:Uncharacterized protein n=1 Tax=Chryseobacterium bernardetii TaxID=1241978 RepID=A0A3G6T9N9_9FLAO|nr:hypothetical protein EG339_08050 [Chryseobacterium bernardetii]